MTAEAQRRKERNSGEQKRSQPVAKDRNPTSVRRNEKKL